MSKKKVSNRELKFNVIKFSQDDLYFMLPIFLGQEVRQTNITSDKNAKSVTGVPENKNF